MKRLSQFNKIVLNRFQLRRASRFINLIAYFLLPQIVLLSIKITTLPNLSVIDIV